MITSVINEEGFPVEIAPGRGNLRRSSVPWNLELRRSLRMVDRVVSFSRLFASQPMVAAASGRLLKMSTRVPLRAYRRVDDENRVPLNDQEHPLAAALCFPWEGGSQTDLVFSLLGPKIVHGNALEEIQQGARNAIRFRSPDWRYAMPIMPWRDTISGWQLDRDNPETLRDVPADQVLHVADWSPLGPIGISPLEQLGVTIEIEDAAIRHQRAMLKNSARPPSALIASADFLGLKPEERTELLDNLREDIREIYAGPDNSGRPALLPPGLEWKAVGHTAVEAQLIEQRAVDKQEAMALFGLTPALMGIIERTPELEVQRQMAVTEGLAPHLIVIESAINAQVAVGLLREPDVCVEFDFSGILRGDHLAEIQAQREAISSALKTPNEGRAALGLPKSSQEGMDSMYLPRNNLIPLDVPYAPKGMAAGGPSPSQEGAQEGAQQGQEPRQEHARELAGVSAEE